MLEAETMARRWLPAVFAGLLIAGLAVIAILGRNVLSDADMLATAQNDDISWNISQLEVELLRTQNAALEFEARPEIGFSEFRQRYDIFHSRVSILTQGMLFKALREDPSARAALAATNDFLARTDPLVDGPDAELRAALPDIRVGMAALHPQLRELTLLGVQKFVRLDAERRETLSETLSKLATALMVLIVALVAAVGVLLLLYRKGVTAAHAAQIARSRFEAAVSSSLDAVLVVDVSGRIIEMGGAAETVFGYSREEAIGADMANLIIPDYMRGAHRAGMKRFLETGEKKVIGAGRIRLQGLRKGGELFPVELSVSIAETGGERVFVSFLRDITSQKEAEAALHAARDRAEESEKAKSDLLTVMSHEMRTPLNGILGSLELIDDENLSERQKRHLNSIAVSGELLLTHVNDVLTLSRVTAETDLRDEARFDLRDAVQKVADSLMANAEVRGNRLTVDFLTDGLRWVTGYETQVKQCLVNLLGNAIKFTANGTVSVEVERSAADGLVEFRVCDTGAGIAEENLSRIFDEFVTVDTAFARENTGTGLGLAITKRLVEAMRGEVMADSILGEGSQFVMRIPLPEAKTAAASGPEIEEDEAMPKIPDSVRALVVDDNDLNRMILTDMLQDLGIEVEQASDGYDALRQLTDSAFDIVLLDISMPGIDGIETLHRIRDLDVAWRDVPVLAVTAHASKEDHTMIMRAPFHGLLVKPLVPSRVQRLIAFALDDGGWPNTAPPTSGPEADFKARFGKERYDKALQDVRSDIAALLDDLEAAAALAPDQRKEAHRLCGAAAVLGKEDVWAILQAIETCNDDEWPDKRDRLLSNLQCMAG